MEVIFVCNRYFDMVIREEIVVWINFIEVWVWVSMVYFYFWDRFRFLRRLNIKNDIGLKKGIFYWR